MKIGTLRSKVLERNGEVGFHEQVVEVLDTDLHKSGDRRGFILKEISICLKEQSFLTGISVEFWSFTFEPQISQAMGFSTPTLRFDGSQL